MLQSRSIGTFLILFLLFSSLSFPSSIGSYDIVRNTVLDSNTVYEGANTRDDLIEQGISSIEYRAVLVAINTYSSGNILPYSVNEITQFKNTLLNGGNWLDSNIKMITNGYATKSNVVDAIEWLSNNTDSNDISIFYFVGHGTRNNAGEYLVAYDSWISDSELDTYLDRVSGKVVVLIDTCYSGGFIKELRQANRIIATACKETESTYQVTELQSGIFGYFLNKSLESHTKSIETTFVLTWLFSIYYSTKLSQEYNGTYRIHPQFFDGTILPTRLIDTHSYMIGGNTNILEILSGGLRASEIFKMGT